jgi:hypothetical protein
VLIENIPDEVSPIDLSRAIDRNQALRAAGRVISCRYLKSGKHQASAFFESPGLLGPAFSRFDRKAQGFLEVKAKKNGKTYKVKLHAAIPLPSGRTRRADAMKPLKLFMEVLPFSYMMLTISDFVIDMKKSDLFSTSFA